MSVGAASAGTRQALSGEQRRVAATHLHERAADLAVGDLPRVPNQPGLPKDQGTEHPDDHVRHLTRQRARYSSG